MSSTDYDFDPAAFSGTGAFWRNGKLFPIIAGGAPDDDPGDGDGTPADEGDGTSTDKDDGKSGDDKVFTQDQLNAIVTRETQKAARGKLDPKELGFNSSKEMKDWIESQKSKDDAAKSEEDKAREEAIEAARKEAEQGVLSKANQRLTKAAFLASSVDHGIRREARTDAFLLATTLDAWQGVEVGDDDQVTGFDDAFFDELKEKKPFLFEPEGGEGNGNNDIGAGRRGGGSSDEQKVAALRERYPALRDT